MEAKPRQIKVYQDAQGKKLYVQWLDSLKDGEGKAAVLRRVKNVGKGNFGDCSRYGSITELRIDMGPGYRVYLGQKGQTLVILLIGGEKSSQKKDFKIAERYWNDYEARGEAASSSL